MRGTIIGLGLVLLLVVAGCSRKITSTTTSKVSDSLSVKIVPRFITVNVPGETVTVKEYIECDSLTNKPKPKEFKAATGRAKVTVSVKADGELIATGGCDSLKLQLEARDSIIYHLRREEKETVREKVVYETRPIDKFCRPFTGIALLLITGFIFYKLNKLNLS
jgi:hypothetical protein